MKMAKAPSILDLECQKFAKTIADELIKEPIKSKRILFVSDGSNGLSELLMYIKIHMLFKTKLGDKIKYLSKDGLQSLYHYDKGFYPYLFSLIKPQIFLLDDFQLFFEFFDFWKDLQLLIEKSKQKNILVIAAVNSIKVYDKKKLDEVSKDFDTIIHISKPTLADIIQLSEMVLTDYNPVTDLKHNLGLDLKSLMNEIEREAGYPENVKSYK